MTPCCNPSPASPRKKQRCDATSSISDYLVLRPLDLVVQAGRPPLLADVEPEALVGVQCQHFWDVVGMRPLVGQHVLGRVGLQGVFEEFC